MANAEAITASEFRQNFGKYMELVSVQDYLVTRNGKVVGMWSNPNRDRMSLVESLAGSIHAVVDEAADRKERRSRQ